MIKLTVPGKPMGKQRPRVVKTGFAFTPKETVNYETLLKHIYTASGNKGYFDGPLVMNIKAYFDIPKSTSKKQAALMIQGEVRPTKKPDMDNIYKIIADALNGIAYHDDSQIVQAFVEKYYAVEPRVEIEIERLKEGLS